MRQMEESENAQPVRDSDIDDVIVLFYKIMAVVHRLNRSSKFITAAVNPHDDWFLCRGFVPRRPEIQIQAVFTLIVE